METRHRSRSALAAGLGLATLLLVAGDARAAIDADAEVVKVRTDCSEAGQALDNCFTTMGALVSWIGGTRQPSAAAPLLVDVGPGTFGRFSCSNGGYTTLRGSGRDQTILDNATLGVSMGNCQQVGFEDLTIHSDEIAVRWFGGGTSTWTDVDMIGGAETGTTTQPAYAWQDLCAPGTDQLHFFFGSRLIVNASSDVNLAVVSTCAETWFYGGDIVVQGTAGTPSNVVLHSALGAAGPQASWHLFGATVRAVVGGAGHMTVTSPPGVFAGVFQGFGGILASTGATVHMHGGIVSVDASGADPGIDYDALGAGSFDYVGYANLVHTPGTAYAVKAAGSGTPIRVTGPNVKSPFLWQAGDAPPAPGLVTETGSDLWVDTGCSASACNQSGSDPHLMIYKDDCPNSPWFDVVRGVCRD